MVSLRDKRKQREPCPTPGCSNTKTWVAERCAACARRGFSLLLRARADNPDLHPHPLDPDQEKDEEKKVNPEYNKREWITVPEAAKRFGYIGLSSIYALIHTKKVYGKRGSDGKHLVDAVSLDRYQKELYLAPHAHGRGTPHTKR